MPCDRVLPEILLQSSALVSFVTAALVLAGILIAVYIVYRLGQWIIKLIVGIIVNTVLGFIALLLLNWLFKLGIPYTLPVLLSTALFGLPAVGTLIILKVIGGITLALA